MEDLIRQFKGRDHGPWVQFVKYGIAGVISTAVHTAIFYLMARNILPALSTSPVSDALRARNAMIDNVVAFMISNMTAYVINIFWVFERGRHHWVKEIAVFYLVSGVSVTIGTVLMGWLIHSYGIMTAIAFFANVIVSLMINFVMRKFYVFKG